MAVSDDYAALEQQVDKTLVRSVFLRAIKQVDNGC